MAIPGYSLSLSGRFEDCFLYMGQLLAVRDDRTLVQADIESLLARSFPDPQANAMAQLFLLRNDNLKGAGATVLMQSDGVRSAIVAGAMQQQIEVEDDEWVETDDFSRILPAGNVLDLQVYAQRLLVATTMGMIHSDLIDNEGTIRLTPAIKRTDARCVSVTARSGSVIGSCADEGLFVWFDEFRELPRHSMPFRHFTSERSLRASWLGYHLVNYPSPGAADSYRSTYQRLSETASSDRSGYVITGMRPDPTLLAPEVASWRRPSFVFNNYNSFFARYPDGTFTLHRRQWAGGRLGEVTAEVRGATGDLSQPISVHPCDAGLVIELFDRVVLLSADGLDILHEGEAVAVRTFPSSKRFTNIVALVTDDSLTIVSPIKSRMSELAT